MRYGLRRRLRTGLAALALVAATSASQVLIPAEPASALCSNGFGGPLEMRTSWGQEDPSEYAGGPTTCDNDNYYNGVIFDILTDGSCVWIWYYDVGYSAVQQTSCNASGNWYQFWDTNSDSYADVQMCRNQGCTFGTQPTGNY